MRESSLSGLSVYFLCLLTMFSLSMPVFGQVVINEIVASNQNGFADEDGEYSDWIELYNTGEEPINLEGYGISDDPEDLFKWEFPDMEIGAGEYLLVFASDKNREGTGVEWETAVREGDDTRYIVPDATISGNWMSSGFDDSSWDSGPLGVGYGDGDDNSTVPSGTVSIFTRTYFNIENMSDIEKLLLHVDFDDGYVAYLNGTEIVRKEMPAGEINYDTPTTTYTEPKLVFGESLDGINLDEYADLLIEGENVLAIQVHNINSGSSDLTLIPFLSIGYSGPQDNSRGVAEEIQLDENSEFYPHTNFKLSADGETVVLSKSDGILADEVAFPALNPDESYGRSASDAETWNIFQAPTPLSENSDNGYEERLSIPELTLSGGFYNTTVEVDFTEEPASNVYYTTDGAVPTASSKVFDAPVLLSETTTLRMRAIEDGQLSSDVETHTFFIDAEHDLPVVSLVTEPDNLWSDESGIYTDGTNGITGNCSNGPKNWNQDWEVPAHIEFYETEGEGFHSNVGIKIFGGCSRNEDPKSLSVFFRGEYGNPQLEYPLFEEKNFETFESFILRNSGNDVYETYIRDALMKTLIEETEIDYQAYQPAVLYLNGEYWGIHNIREKINEHYISSNHGVDTDDIELVENNGFMKHGSAEGFNAFMSALENADMSNQQEYEEVLQYVDLDNYIDYMAAQIFYVNRDWPGNNLRYWREKGGKFRWIMYDTDFGFNMYGGHPPNTNMFEFATATNGPDWPNPEWSTFIFRKFLESESFEHALINRFGDLLNTAFDESHIVSTIDSLSQRIASEMPAHKNRWGGNYSDWQNRINNLKGFANDRIRYFKGHLTSFFEISGQNPITVDVSNHSQGSVQVNRLVPHEYPWTGEYFGEVPIKITAIPKPGYTFTGWSGNVSSGNRSIEVYSEDEPDLTANFEPLQAEPGDIIINEIMYNAPDEADPEDWVELYNTSNSALNISGWVLKDEDDDHEFIFPEGSVIDAEGYLVVVQNENLFRSLYGNIEPVTGYMGFGLGGGGDQVRLFTEADILADSVEYDDAAPWPLEADGNGHSLELDEPKLDNVIGENWNASAQVGGTPGSENGIITSSEDEKEVPIAVNLKQNYPNPFNPTTDIRFELPQRAEVKLSIYDLLGREVSVLQDGMLSAGTHQLRWNAEAFASGVYLYKLEVNRQVFIKKMILAK